MSWLLAFLLWAAPAHAYLENPLFQHTVFANSYGVFQYYAGCWYELYQPEYLYYCSPDRLPSDFYDGTALAFIRLPDGRLILIDPTTGKPYTGGTFLSRRLGLINGRYGVFGPDGQRVSATAVDQSGEMGTGVFGIDTHGNLVRLVGDARYFAGFSGGHTFPRFTGFGDGNVFSDGGGISDFASRFLDSDVTGVFRFDQQNNVFQLDRLGRELDLNRLPLDGDGLDFGECAGEQCIFGQPVPRSDGRSNRLDQPGSGDGNGLFDPTGDSPDAITDEANILNCEAIDDYADGYIFGPVPCTSYPGVFGPVPRYGRASR